VSFTRKFNILTSKIILIMFIILFFPHLPKMFFDVSWVDSYNHFYHRVFSSKQNLKFHFTKSAVSSPLNLLGIVELRQDGTSGARWGRLMQFECLPSTFQKLLPVGYRYHFSLQLGLELITTRMIDDRLMVRTWALSLHITAELMPTSWL